jgi:hypothetical protein
MLTRLNEGDWVALYDGGTHVFVKVARIEHKFVLTGKEAKSYKKNVVEILMIRHKDRDSKVLDSDGSIKGDYIIVDASTGKELDGKHHNLIVEQIPMCKNLIFDDTGLSWGEMIERQKIIYMLSDTDWKTTNTSDLDKISRIMFEAQLRRDTHEG